MKVQHKDHPHGYVYTVVEESPNFYVAMCAALIPDDLYALVKKDYRILPTERWVDVTDEVEVRDNVYTKGNPAGLPDGVFHGSHRLAKLVCSGGYRVRKEDNGVRCTLLVEKKESL